MSNYRRAYEKGGCYFFTVVTYKRRPVLTQSENIVRLRDAFSHVMKAHPFSIDGIVVLPNHLHCILRLPEDDSDFSTRWRLIKHYVSTKAGPQFWQHRFWEHLIRDEEDWKKHMDYVHYNPVKHGLARSPNEWEFSSFSRCLDKGWYAQGWGAEEPSSIIGLDLE